MSIVVQEEYAAEDIAEYCHRNGLSCAEIPRQELEQWTSHDFLAHTYICDTAVVQQHLCAVGVKCVPDTYDDRFRDHYHRRIHKQLFGRIDFAQPVFVKPCGNTKSFDGCVLRHAHDFQDESDTPTADTEVYVAEVVKFVSEYRLFVGNGRLYAQGHMSGLITLRPTAAFISDILSACGRDYICVDVGYMLSPTANTTSTAPSTSSTLPPTAPLTAPLTAPSGTWAVVEINPPFSLDDYGVPISDYVGYCIDACAWIRRHIADVDVHVDE